MAQRNLLLFLLLILGIKSEGRQNFITKRNLQHEWQAYHGGRYISYDQQQTSTIYFSIDAGNFKGDLLTISSANSFSVFINKSLVTDHEKDAQLSLDSLSNVFQASLLFFTIRQDQKITPNDLATKIISPVLSASTVSNYDFFKKDTSFRNFVVLAFLTLLIFLISLIRLNPRLSSDYFSITRMFSLRESDEDQFYYRLTSSNILFFVFTSLMVSFCIVVISQFIKTPVTNRLLEAGTNNLTIWMTVALIVLGFISVKLIVIHVITSLFNVKEVAGLHFFNFIRLLMLTLGIVTVIMVGYYLLHGEQESFYSFLYGLVYWILGGWIALIFLKLASRVQYSAFHLFSYICATEIIPFLLVIKVLNE